MQYPVQYKYVKDRGLCRRSFLSSSVALALVPSIVRAQNAPVAGKLTQSVITQATPSEISLGDRRAQSDPGKVVDANAFVTFSLAINDSTIRSLMHAINTVRTYQIGNIYVMIDSTGGSIESAVDFYNFISSISTPVHTVNMSRVASAANYIYLAGEKRYAYRASYFLLHPGKSNASIQGLTQQSFDDLKSGLAVSEGLFRSILAERAKLPSSEINKVFKSEVYYSPRQAFDYGIVNDLSRPVIRDEDLFLICSEKEGGYWRDF